MATSPSAPTPHAVTGELAQVAVILERSVSWLRRALRPAEWNSLALSTLDAVARLGPLRITDLVVRERITQPGMTGLVVRLEAADLVTRRADPLDGRATLVEITPAGAGYLQLLHQRRADALADHLSQLSPADQRSLVAARDALDALIDLPLDMEGL